MKLEPREHTYCHDEISFGVEHFVQHASYGRPEKEASTFAEQRPPDLLVVGVQ